MQLLTKAHTSPEAMAVYLAASGRKVKILSILSILSKKKNQTGFTG
jgi:hypothetical protein